MKIILVRHAQTIKNKAEMAQGHGDSDLTEEGKIQSEKTRDFLKDKNINVAYCSSLGRAVKTANYILEPHNIEVIPRDELREIDWGEFSSLPTPELLKTWSNYYENEKIKGIPRRDIRPPKGENSFDHMKRIKIFLGEAIKEHSNQTILIVGHGGTNKVIIGMLNEVDPEEFYTVKQDNACINYLEVDENGKLTDSEINKTDHLSE